MNRQQLLDELRRHTYVALRPSAIEGVGVFATRDIPVGCRDMFSRPDTPESWIALARSDVEALPQHSRLLVETYCLYDEHQYFVPENGFKKMDLVCYVNHSDTPNIRSIDDGNYFEALRDIHADEEIVIDYGEIVDDR